MHSWNRVIYGNFFYLCAGTGVQEKGDWHEEGNLYVARTNVWSQLRDVSWLCDYVAIKIT